MRDLVGYGARRPPARWPGGARLALSLVVNYEEGAERTMERDGVNEGLGEVRRELDPGVSDLATQSVYEYGARAGIHRLLDIHDRAELRCTVFAVAEALERNPDLAARLATGEHEVCAHGLRWSEDWLADEETQRRQIGAAVTSIAASTGHRPVGWYSRWMPSAHTRRLLVAEGGFLYDSDAYNDDLPYYVTVDGHPHLIIPYTLTYNDARLVDGTLGGPAEFLALCRGAVDLLCDEGASRPAMMSVGLHPRISGQAGRAAVVAELIAHARRRGDVWFATRAQIAAHWLAEHPPA